MLCIQCVAVERIVLIGSEDTKNSMHGRWLDLIYQEVFKRLGYEFQYDSYPSDISSKMSDAGRVDGEINRVAMYQATHPNMIRVDESHFATTLTAYTTVPKLSLDGWDSFKNSHYLVGYRRGTRIVEKGLAKVLKQEDISTVSTIEQGLKMLLNNRIDVYVDVEDLVDENLLMFRSVGYDTDNVGKAGLMAKDTLHVYLHKKNALLVPRIAQVLKEMKKEGLVDQFKQEAMVGD